MKSIRILCAVVLLLTAATTWAASGNGPLGALKAKLKADHQAVHADKASLDQAEEAAGMTPSFQHNGACNHHNNNNGNTAQARTASNTQAPGQHIAQMLKHVAHEIQKVQNLLAQANLPSAVNSAAQKLLTDLNTLKADLTQAQTALGSAGASGGATNSVRTVGNRPSNSQPPTSL